MTTTLVLNEATDCVTLPMRSELGAARIDGVPVDARIEGGRLRACGVGWDAGTRLALSVDTALDAPEENPFRLGYVEVKDTAGEPFHSLVSWFGGCDLFGPCDNAPDRFARYRFEIDHAEGLQVLCPGTLEPGATHSACDFDLPGGPTYSTFALFASPSWTRIELGRVRGVDIVLYDVPWANYAAAIDRKLVTGFLAWMIDHFGPYPYGDELRLVVGPVRWSGFEHPGNITLRDGSYTGSYLDPVHHKILHEIAHQWAGDQTTLADVHDFAWKEAMADYLTFVYEEERMAPSVSAHTLMVWESKASDAYYHPVPAERPPLSEHFNDVYGASAMVFFRQPEAMFGRDQVFEALRTLLGTERILSAAEVVAALEGATGADLSAYANAWIFGEGRPVMPQFAVDHQPTDGGLLVTVRQTNPEIGFHGCAFAVVLEGEGESVEVVFDLGPDGAASASRIVPAGFAIERIWIDPHQTCLANGAQQIASAGRRTEPWAAEDEALLDH